MQLENALFETERMVLRRFDADDVAFILRLLNEPSFIQFIGDRASEAAAAVLERARNAYGLARFVGVVVPTNAASIRILEKLEFQPQGMVVDPRNGTELLRYEWTTPLIQ